VAVAADVRKVCDDSSSIEPSFGPLATASEPMMLPAPGRFSTITVVSSRLANCGWIARAMASLLAPGAKGTTSRISRGTSCAAAGRPAASNRPATTLPDLTAEEIERATRIVAVAGSDPFRRLLEQGADVIIGGRCGDINFTAGPCIHHGFPEALAYHMGKMIECASLVAEPFMGKEAIVGTITQEDIRITPYHPDQRCTVASVAGHSMYERESPYEEHALGGMLDMRDCVYEQYDERTARITGARWIPAQELRVKIEGARKVGERYMGFVGLRDPHVIAHVDDAIAWCRRAVEGRFGQHPYELHFHVFGRDGVLKELEPQRHSVPHELGVVVEGVAATDALAEKITDFAVRMFFLLRIPGVKGTAGSAATTKKTMKSSPGYVWNVNHTVPIDDPMELFPLHFTTAGVPVR
jgi:hypothetical protein